LVRHAAQSDLDKAKAISKHTLNIAKVVRDVELAKQKEDAAITEMQEVKFSMSQLKGEPQVQKDTKDAATAYIRH